MCEDILNIQHYIIDHIKKEDISLADDDRESNSIEEKINITSTILNNVSLVFGMEDFYEEECQLSLLTWAYEIYYISNLSEDKIDRKNLEILLFNILNIFEIFPIKPTDLISLNFIEKLNKIKRSIKNWNFALACKIHNLVSYWNRMIKIYYSIKEEENKPLLQTKKVSINLLSRKRERGEEEEEEENVSSSTLSSLGVETEGIAKRVSFKEEESFLDIIVFDPSCPVSEISNQ